MKRLIFLFSILMLVKVSIAQQFPVGTCGIVVVHDANGAQTKRTYFCNNGVDPWPTRAQNTGVHAETFTNTTTNVVVDKFYPNPTNGFLNVEMAVPLENAAVSILDINGKILKSAIHTGKILKVDFSSFPTGTYFLLIKLKNKTIKQKIVRN